MIALSHIFIAQFTQVGVKFYGTEEDQGKMTQPLLERLRKSSILRIRL